MLQAGRGRGAKRSCRASSQSGCARACNRPAAKASPAPMRSTIAVSSCAGACVGRPSAGQAQGRQRVVIDAVLDPDRAGQALQVRERGEGGAGRGLDPLLRRCLGEAAFPGPPRCRDGRRTPGRPRPGSGAGSAPARRPTPARACGRKLPSKLTRTPARRGRARGGDGRVGAALPQRRGHAGQVQPVGAVEQSRPVVRVGRGLREGGVGPVVEHLAGPLHGAGLEEVQAHPAAAGAHAARVHAVPAQLAGGRRAERAVGHDAGHPDASWPSRARPTATLASAPPTCTSKAGRCSSSSRPGAAEAQEQFTEAYDSSWALVLIPERNCFDDRCADCHVFCYAFLTTGVRNSRGK